MSAPEARIPVHVLTGFLGSGKTTLLNALLKEASLAATAVVVNELGDIGIDHLLVERSEDQLVELSGGCLCCAVRGDLAQTLADLLGRRAAGTCSPFERVLIETSGLADPAPVLNLLVTDPVLSRQARAGTLVATVDAANGHQTLDRHPEARKQVALADRIIVTKADIAPLAAIQVGERVRSINPRAEHLSATDGRADGPLFDDAGPVGEPPAADIGHHHSDGVETFTLVREQPVPGAAVALLVEGLAQQLGADLLRVKGLVALAERPHTPAVVQGAQHVYYPIDFMSGWPDGDRRTRLVFITLGPARDWVEAYFDMLVWEARDVASRLARA